MSSKLVSRAEARPDLPGAVVRGAQLVEVPEQLAGRQPAGDRGRPTVGPGAHHHPEAVAVWRSRAPARWATVSDPDGLLTCLECGRRLRNLGPHLARAHSLDAAGYRARHDLPATAALSSDQTRALMRTNQLAAMRADPTILPRLQAGPWPTPRVPVPRIPRDTGPARDPAAALERNRTARAAGHPDWATAIEATRDLTQQGAARRLGCAVSTVKRWRNRIEAAAPPLVEAAATGARGGVR